MNKSKPSMRWWTADWKFPRMVDILKPAKLGIAEITHFRVTAEEAESNSYARNELWLPGDYCELEIDGVGWMWDIPDEWLKNEDAVENATGDVLIVGLGMGLILHPILAKPEVHRVHVIEKCTDVRDLVLPSLNAVKGAEKLTVEIADGWTYQIDQKYDAIWLDAIPCYSPEPWWFEAVEKWMRRYRPMLRDQYRSYLGHWAYLEMIEHVLGDACMPRRRRRKTRM